MVESKAAVMARLQVERARNYEQKIKELRAENAELEALFSLRHKSDVQAIKMWRKEKPAERALTMPSHDDLCVWLMDENATLRAALVKAKDDLIWSTGGWGQATEEMLAVARILMRQNVEAIDAALASVKEEQG